MTGELSAAQIQQLIPHRYPFLLVDRILEVEEGKRAVGIKAVTVNEHFFQGHFPGFPVMPGVLIAEALAQVAAVSALKTFGGENVVPLLVGLDNFRFRKPVTPGDVIRLEVMLSHLSARSGRFHGKATVEGKLAAEGDITFVVTTRDRMGA